MDESAVLERPGRTAREDDPAAVGARLIRRTLLALVVVAALVAAVLVVARIASDRARADSALAHHQALARSVGQSVSAVVQAQLELPPAQRSTAVIEATAQLGSDPVDPDVSDPSAPPVVRTTIIASSATTIVTSTTISSDGYSGLLVYKTSHTTGADSTNTSDVCSQDTSQPSQDAVDCAAWALTPLS